MDILMMLWDLIGFGGHALSAFVPHIHLAVFGIDDAFVIATLASAAGQAASSGQNSLIQRARLQQWLNQLKNDEREAIATGTTNISKQIAGATQGARSSGARRALALGKKNEAESFIAPIESKIANAGSQSIREYIAGVQRTYAQQRSKVEGEIAGLPAGINLGDIVSTGAEAFSRLKQGQDVLNAQKETDKSTQDLLKSILGMNKPATSAVSPSPIDFSTQGGFNSTMLDMNTSANPSAMTLPSFSRPKKRKLSDTSLSDPMNYLSQTSFSSFRTGG